MYIQYIYDRCTIDTACTHTDIIWYAGCVIQSAHWILATQLQMHANENVDVCNWLD